MENPHFAAPKNKAEFYRRWHALEFGNLPRMWTSVDDLVKDDLTCTGEVTIRSLVPGGNVMYRIPCENLRQENHNIRSMLPSRGYIIQESMPDEFLEIQGSIRLGINGIHLDYSLEPNLKFREALSPPFARYHCGLAASMVLKSHVDPSGLDDLLELLNRFPNAVVEFATYRVPVGILSRRTVIFEVRNY